MKVAVIFCFCIAAVFGQESEPHPLSKMFHDQCQEDVECITEWTSCTEDKKGVKRCLCINGFEEHEDGVCHAKAVVCPIIRSSGSVIEFDGRLKKIEPCMLERNPNTGEEVNKCSEPNMFCFVHGDGDGAERSPNNIPSGHCCPSPREEDGQFLEHSCPFNVSLAGASCSDNADSSSLKLCPRKTHDCVTHQHVTAAKCCPKPCRGDLKFFPIQGKGMCFRKAAAGEACKFTAECPDDLVCKTLTGDPKDLSCQKKQQSS